MFKVGETYKSRNGRYQYKVIYIFPNGKIVAVGLDEGIWFSIECFDDGKYRTDVEGDYDLMPNIARQSYWTNWYKCVGSDAVWQSSAYVSRKSADQVCNNDRVACIRTDWEQDDVGCVPRLVKVEQESISE